MGHKRLRDFHFITKHNKKQVNFDTVKQLKTLQTKNQLKYLLANGKVRSKRFAAR
jgi:hypothetical protein